LTRECTGSAYLDLTDMALGGQPALRTLQLICAGVKGAAGQFTCRAVVEPYAPATKSAATAASTKEPILELNGTAASDRLVFSEMSARDMPETESFLAGGKQDPYIRAYTVGESAHKGCQTTVQDNAGTQCSWPGQFLEVAACDKLWQQGVVLEIVNSNLVSDDLIGSCVLKGDALQSCRSGIPATVELPLIRPKHKAQGILRFQVALLVAGHVYTPNTVQHLKPETLKSEQKAVVEKAVTAATAAAVAATAKSSNSRPQREEGVKSGSAPSAVTANNATLSPSSAPVSKTTDDAGLASSALAAAPVAASRKVSVGSHPRAVAVDQNATASTQAASVSRPAVAARWTCSHVQQWLCADMQLPQVRS
jgi:hypothetical protein